jgi:Ca2+-binding RTX toxin-like protein
MRIRKPNATPGLAAALAACFLALVPAPADAATANIRIKRVYYTADAGEVNNLIISLAGNSYTLSDPGATITAGPGCTAAGHVAVCPAAGIIGLTVSAGDGADGILNNTATPSTLSGGDGSDSLQGGAGNDILRGNQGVDSHAGGRGDDFIDSRGDKGDLVSCGLDHDVVKADPSDVVSGDCEDVDRGSEPPRPASGHSPTATDLLGPSETGNLDPGACLKDRLGSPENDALDGTGFGDSLFGVQGNDVLRGLAGDDCLFGGIGSDRLYGGKGDDHLFGDDSAAQGVGGKDELFGNSGNDVLVGGAGPDRLRGGRGNDRLSGGPGRNALSGGPGKDRLNSVNGRFDWLDCGHGRDRARADQADSVRGCERVHRVR